MQPTEPITTPNVVPDVANKKHINVPAIIMMLMAIIFAGLAVFFGIKYFGAEAKEPNEANLSPVADSSNEVTTTSSTAEEYEEGYFYLSDWGLKVKLNGGTNYKVLGYLYDSVATTPGASQGYYEIWGGSYIPEEGTDYYPAFYPSSSNDPALHLERYITELIPERARFYGEYHQVFNDDTYTYYAITPNGDPSGIEDDELIQAIIDFWKNAGFINAENWSKI